MKRRLVAVLMFAVAIPGLLLSYGSLQAVRADRIVLRKLRDERLAGAARDAVARIEEEARERARAALAAVEAAAVAARAAAFPRDPSAAAARRAEVEAALERAREAEPLLCEVAIVRLVPAAEARLLVPADPRREPPPGPPGPDLTAHFLERLEKRRGGERRLVDARALEAHGERTAALALFRTLADEAADAEIAARARLDAARCEARLGHVDAAIDDLEVLARVGPELKTDDRLSIAVAARLLGAELRLATGRRDEAAARLADLYEDLVERRLPLEPDEERTFLERARAALEGPRLAGAPEPPSWLPERLARLAARARRAAERRAYATDFAARVLPDLVAAVHAAPRTDDMATLATIGGAPRLFAYRIAGAGEDLIVICAEIDLGRLAAAIAAPWLARLGAERAAALELVDRRGAAIAGDPLSGDAAEAEQATTETFEDILPFWKVRAAPIGLAEEERLARFRLLLQIGMVLLLALAMGIGAWWTVRAVDRSLELARLKAEFVSNVSHELRTPLTSIRMFAELLRSGRAKSDAKREEYLDTIARESERLQRLIDDILDFARHEAGRERYSFEEADLGEVAEEALDAVAPQLEEAGFKVALDIRGPLPAASVDRRALRGAIENLLGNARKYSADRREVAVRVAPDGGASVRIEVEDRGVGIPPEELPRIFEKFYRGSGALALGVPGSGLGLSLAKRIVEAHGGRIGVRSTPGEGTTFSIWIPAQKGADRAR